MIRKLTSLLITFVFLLCLTVPASAESNPLVVDDAGLLLPDEIAALEEKAAELNNRYGIDAVILTVDSLGGIRAQDYADDYYDQSGYGEDGILFLLALAEREWYISTCGSLIYTLTDYGIQQLGNEVVPYLGEGRWYDGFCAYLDTLPVYLDAYESGAPVDGFADYSGDYYHGDQEEVVYYQQESKPNFLISLLIGAAAAAVTILIMKSSMNTKRSQRTASVYMNNGTWNLTLHQDLFLYSNVTRTRKQEPPKSSGGGSSVHRSSGGRSHGGGGGRF